MYKFLPGLLFWLLAGNSCFAQDSILIVSQNQWYLKISPVAVFEADGGIGFSAEYLLSKAKLGFQLEIQPLLFSVAPNGYKVDQPKDVLESGRPSGIKLRPEIRYYLRGLRPTPTTNSELQVLVESHCG